MEEILGLASFSVDILESVGGPARPEYRVLFLYWTGTKNIRVTPDLKGPAGRPEDLRFSMVGADVDLMWETSNKANQVFNPTKKDDVAGNVDDQEEESWNETIYGCPREKVYVVANDANQYGVSLDLSIRPVSLRSRFLVAAYVNGTKVAGSDTPVPAQGNAQINMTFADPSSGAAVTDFRIKTGLDINGNGTLDGQDMIFALEVYQHATTEELKYATVRGINKAQYEWHEEKIAWYVNPTAAGVPLDPGGSPNLIAPFPRSFLHMFMNGNDGALLLNMKPDITRLEPMNAFLNATSTNSCFSEWLTHNSGAGFSDQGLADIPFRQWNQGTRVSEFFAERTPFALETEVLAGDYLVEFQTPTGEALEEYYNGQFKAAAEALLQNQPDGATVTMPQGGGFQPFPFTSKSPSWVPTATSEIGSGPGCDPAWAAVLAETVLGGTDSYDEFQALGAIGLGRIINPRYRFCVQKDDDEYPVIAVDFRCDLEDLWDFNYEDGELAGHAAAHQIGYGNRYIATGRDRRYNKGITY